MLRNQACPKKNFPFRPQQNKLYIHQITATYKNHLTTTPFPQQTLTSPIKKEYSAIYKKNKIEMLISSY